uniref:Uncharacterized protein n=1 Tax=Anopheles atroparvus TaxID=41427 RepID=A0AAG5D2T9_ANOAO
MHVDVVGKSHLWALLATSSPAARCREMPINQQHEPVVYALRRDRRSYKPRKISLTDRRSFR